MSLSACGTGSNVSTGRLRVGGGGGGVMNLSERAVLLAHDTVDE